MYGVYYGPLICARPRIVIFRPAESFCHADGVGRPASTRRRSSHCAAASTCDASLVNLGMDLGMDLGEYRIGRLRHREELHSTRLKLQT